jgi:hypothetical protein
MSNRSSAQGSNHVSTVVVQYRPRADQADENQRLVEEVFAELAKTRPGGIRYATWRLADGTFVHIAELDADLNPLSANAAFQRFQHGIIDRCEAGAEPNPSAGTLVGAYNFSPSHT